MKPMMISFAAMLLLAGVALADVGPDGLIDWSNRDEFNATTPTEDAPAVGAPTVTQQTGDGDAVVKFFFLPQSMYHNTFGSWSLISCQDADPSPANKQQSYRDHISAPLYVIDPSYTDDSCYSLPNGLGWDATVVFYETNTSLAKEMEVPVDGSEAHPNILKFLLDVNKDDIDLCGAKVVIFLSKLTDCSAEETCEVVYYLSCDDADSTHWPVLCCEAPETRK